MARVLQANIVALGALGLSALLLGAGAFLAVGGGAVGALVGAGTVALVGGAAMAWFAMWRAERRRGAAEAKSRAVEAKSRAAALTEQSRTRYHVTRMADALRETKTGVDTLNGALTKVAAASQNATHVSGGGKVDKVKAPAVAVNPVRNLAPGAAKPARPAASTPAERRLHQPIEGAAKAAWLSGRQGGPVEVTEVAGPQQRTGRLPFASEIPVVMIADDFTFNSFRPEFDTHRLHPATWRKTMEAVKPRMFFCESAWQGGDPSKAPWQGKIYSSARYSHENREVLLSIIEYCRAEGIPTVFWNKEDPTHFGDRINDFVRTAYLFDYVFTTAEECVEDYKRHIKSQFADVLPFAVQPALFNPLGRDDAEDVVNFAGTWYGMYPERCAAAESIMDLVLESGRDLVIYNRMFTSPNPIYTFPERYQRFVRPAIPYTQTAESYRQARFGITLNTVADSSTMFARRVFELAAAGSVVLSNYAVGVERFFGDSVIFADRDPDRFLRLTEHDHRLLQQDALAVALRNTYTHRAQTILTAVGIPFVDRFEAPAGLAAIRSVVDFDIARANLDAHGGLSGLVAVVADDADPGLQMGLMRERPAGVTVVSEAELARRDYRTRTLLDRRGVVVADRHLAWPATSDLEYLTLHDTYTTGPVKLADEDLVFVEQETTLEHCYVDAASFGAVMQEAPTPLSTVRALRV